VFGEELLLIVEDERVVEFTVGAVPLDALRAL